MKDIDADSGNLDILCILFEAFLAECEGNRSVTITVGEIMEALRFKQMRRDLYGV